jgi:hypothetical protein
MLRDARRSGLAAVPVFNEYLPGKSKGVKKTRLRLCSLASLQHFSKFTFPKLFFEQCRSCGW